MLLGITLFDEAGSARQWNYDANGSDLSDHEFDQDLARLDGTVNGSLTSLAELLIVARQCVPSHGIRIWIGLYGYTKGRNNKGNRGAGLWLLNGHAPGVKVLGFLKGLAESWAAKDLGSARQRQPWEAFDPGYALLSEFTKNASDMPPIEQTAPDRPEVIGLINLAANQDTLELEPWLDEMQTNPACFRFKKVYISSDPAVSRAILNRGATLLYPTAQVEEPVSPPTNRDDVTLAEGRGQTLSSAPPAQTVVTSELFEKKLQIARTNHADDLAKAKKQIEAKLRALKMQVILGAAIVMVAAVIVIVVGLLTLLTTGSRQAPEGLVTAVGGGKPVSGKPADDAAGLVRSDALVGELLAQMQEALEARDKIRQIHDLLDVNPRLDPSALEKKVREIVAPPIPLPPPPPPPATMHPAGGPK